MRAVFSLIALIVWCASATAGTATDLAAIDKALGACIDKDGTNIGMTMCAGAADAAADAVLNRVYAAASAKLKDPKAQADDRKEILARLVASERAWIAYRDAECALQGTRMLGGTGERLTIIDCHYTMTATRARSLEALFEER